MVTKTGHTEAIKKAVEAGVGAACLSKLAVAREVEMGWLKLLDIEGIDTCRQLWIIQHKDKIVTRLMAEFRTFCEEAVRDRLGCMYSNSPWKLQDLLAGGSGQEEGAS